MFIEAQIFKFDNVQFIFVLFVACAFDAISKKPMQNPRSQKLMPVFSPQSCSLCNMVSLSKKGSYNMGTFWEQCSKCNFNFVLNLFCFIFLFDCFDWKKVKAYTALVMDHAMSIQESLKLKFSQEEKSQETRQKGHHWNGQRKCSL